MTENQTEPRTTSNNSLPITLMIMAAIFLVVGLVRELGALPTT